MGSLKPLPAGLFRLLANRKLEPEMLAFAGRRRAVVAVSRKLAVLLHRMWTENTEFRSEEVEGIK
jgi:hypothetical protein